MTEYNVFYIHEKLIGQYKIYMDKTVVILTTMHINFKCTYIF